MLNGSYDTIKAVHTKRLRTKVFHTEQFLSEIRAGGISRVSVLFLCFFLFSKTAVYSTACYLYDSLEKYHDKPTLKKKSGLVMMKLQTITLPKWLIGVILAVTAGLIGQISH